MTGFDRRALDRGLDLDDGAEAAGVPGKRTMSEHLMAPAGEGRDAAPIVSGLIRRQARDGNGVAAGADRSVAAASGSTGQALPSPVLRKFEASLGADLSSVRVHTGAASAQAAEAVGAKAYTLGQDIHFAAGQYDPAGDAGQQLLAHEVAHTVQQGSGAQRRQYKLEVSSPGDAAEVEADSAAVAMVRGEAAQVGAAAPGIGRKILRDKAADAARKELGIAQAGDALPDGTNLSVSFPNATFRVSWLKDQGLDVTAASPELPAAVSRAVLQQVRQQIFHWATDEMITQASAGATLDGGPFTDVPFIHVTLSQKQMLEAFGLPPGASILWTIADDGRAILTVAAEQFAKLQATGDDAHLSFEDADLSKRIWDQLMAQTGLNARVMVKMVGRAGAHGVVREFTRAELASLVGEDDLADYLAERAKKAKKPADKKADAPKADPNAPKADPNAPAGDPNAPAGDPNAPKADPNAPKADPNAPKADPNAPKADPKDNNTPIGPPRSPIHGANAKADPATAKQAVDEIMKLYQFLLTNFPDHPAFKQGKTPQDFVNWLSRQSQNKTDEDFTYARPRGQWLAFLDKWDQNATLETPRPDATWPESMVSFQPHGTLELDPAPINGQYVMGSWVVARVSWAKEGMSAMLAENPNRCEYRWSVAGSKPGDATAHLGQEVWEGDVSKIIALGLTTRGQDTYRFTFPREGKFAFRCVTTSEHFERLLPFTLTSPEVTVGTLQAVDQKQFDDHTAHSIDGPFEYVNGELRVRPGIQAMTIEDQTLALNKMVAKIREAKAAGTMDAAKCADLEQAIQDKIKKLNEVGVGLENGHAYVISGTLTPDTHGAGGPVAFLLYGTKKTEAGKVTFDVRLIDQTGGKPEVHNGSGSGPEGAAGELAAEKAAIAAAAGHFSSWNHLPDGTVHVGIRLLSNGVVEQQTWSTHNTLKTVQEQAGNAAAWAGRIALAAAIIGTDGLAGTVIEIGAAGLTVVSVGAGQVQRGATGTLGDDKVQEVLDASKIALALAGPLAKTGLGKVVLPPGFVAIALPAGNHLVMAVEQEQELEAINKETNAKLIEARSDAEKQRINDERQAKINALLYKASQDHMIMAVQEVAGHLHGAGKDGFEEPGKAKGKPGDDEQAKGKPDDNAGKPDDNAKGKPDDNAGKPDDNAGKPDEQAKGKPDEDNAKGKAPAPVDPQANAKEARRGDQGRGRDPNAEAEAAGDPHAAGPTRNPGAERAAVDNTLKTMAASGDAVDRNTAEAIKSGKVLVKTRGELTVTQESQGEVYTRDPDTGEGGLVWGKGTKAIASRHEAIIYVDPAAEGGDLAADLRHEVNHALHASDHDSGSRHDSLSRYADEFRAHWVEGDHDPASVKQKILSNYKELAAEYADNPAFKERVDLITKPDGNVTNSVRLEPVFNAIDRFEMTGDKPTPAQLEDWFGKLDPSDRQLLAADGRFRRWFHDQLGLSPADHERLLGKLPPEAAAAAPRAPGDEGKTPHAVQTDGPDAPARPKASQSTPGNGGKAADAKDRAAPSPHDAPPADPAAPADAAKRSHVAGDPAQLAQYRSQYPTVAADPDNMPVYRYAATTAVPDNGVSYWQTRAPHPDYIAPVVLETTIGQLRSQGEVRVDVYAPEATGDSLVVLHHPGVTEAPGVTRHVLGREGAQGNGPAVVEGHPPQGMWRDWAGNVYDGAELVRAAPR